MKLICPHCGASAGVWQKFEAIQYYDADGKPDGYNNEPFSEGKMLYCNKCNKSVCRTSTLLKNN